MLNTKHIRTTKTNKSPSLRQYGQEFKDCVFASSLLDYFMW